MHTGHTHRPHTHGHMPCRWPATHATLSASREEHDMTHTHRQAWHRVMHSKNNVTVHTLGMGKVACSKKEMHGGVHAACCMLGTYMAWQAGR